MKTYSRSWSVITILAVAMLTIIILISKSVRAAGLWYVAPTGNDSNSCLSAGSPCHTINGAIGKASAGDTIYVATGMYTVSTGSEVVLINKSIVLSGGWNAGFTAQSGQSTVNGEYIRRGMTIPATVTANIERFAVQNGTAQYGGGIYNAGDLLLTTSVISGNGTLGYGTYGDGGGIWNGGNLTISNTTISGNGTFTTYGNGGGIWSSGTLTVVATTVRGNQTDFSGGGIAIISGTLTMLGSEVSDNWQFGDGSYGGAGMFNQKGTVVISDSIFNDNSADSFGGGLVNWNGDLMIAQSTLNSNISRLNGGAIRNDASGRMTIVESVIENNGANSSGGGISNQVGTLILQSSAVSGNIVLGTGGGIANSGMMTITQSTVSGNIALDYGGGGIANGGTMALTNSTITSNGTNRDGGGIWNYGLLYVNNSTIASNFVPNGPGGGIYNWVVPRNGMVFLKNTIVANNTALSAADCYGPVNSTGYNLIRTSCTFTPIAGDLTNVDPKLGPLQNNGGPTLTHALLAGSPAINAGNTAGCVDNLGNTLNKDQRDLTRFGRCDIGAYEEQAIKAVNNPIAQPSSTMTYTIAFHNGEINPLAGVWMTDTLPASITYTNNSLTATSGSYGYDAGVITWTGTISADEIITITFAVGVSQGLPLNVPITNTAVINDGSTVFNRTATMLVAYQLFFPLIKR